MMSRMGAGVRCGLAVMLAAGVLVGSACGPAGGSFDAGGTPPVSAAPSDDGAGDDATQDGVHGNEGVSDIYGDYDKVEITLTGPGTNWVVVNYGNGINEPTLTDLVKRDGQLEFTDKWVYHTTVWELAHDGIFRIAVVDPDEDDDDRISCSLAVNGEPVITDATTTIRKEPYSPALADYAPKYAVCDAIRSTLGLGDDD